MPYASLMQLKDASGANKFEMKGWRWDTRLVREIKVNETKSFPGTEPNPPIGLDFGSKTTHYTLQGRLKTQKQLNDLKLKVVKSWYEDAPTTLKIGTGGTAITKTGLVVHLHSKWTEKDKKFTITLKFWDTTVFTI